METENLEDGIYALQLVLIMERQRVEKVSLIISVDNTPPEMEFVTDIFSGDIFYEEDTEILFEVEFENDLEIEQVEFFINDDLLTTRKLPPYIVPWLTVPGQHEVKIIARDQAGNTADYSALFEVLSE